MASRAKSTRKIVHETVERSPKIFDWVSRAIAVSPA
jgi:hypothetical protein